MLSLCTAEAELIGENGGSRCLQQRGLALLMVGFVQALSAAV
jgi:hypothetical protein